MRAFLGLLAALPVLAGCQSSEPSDPVRTQVSPGKTSGLTTVSPPATPAGPTNRAEPAPVLLPTSGRIHSVDDRAHFVVIDYTLGGLPPPQSQLSVYRNGEKVGTLRLSGPAMHGFATADIEDGFVQVDDEVRIR